jgi:transposase
VNLDNNRVISIVNSRETKDVQAVLDTFPNLKFLSRDRGKQYQNLSDKYIHVADRFHIIKNLSDNLIKSLHRLIPNKVSIEVDIDEKKEAELPEKAIGMHNDNSEKTVAHQNKIVLIKQVQAAYEKNNNIRATARVFKISRTTIKKYLLMDDIEKKAAYDISTRSSHLDQFKDIILDKYYSWGVVTKVHEFLSEKGIKVKYGILNRYINKHKNASEIKLYKDSLTKKKITIINRRDIIKKVFNWQCNDDNTTNYIEELKNLYPIIREYQSFYQTFKYALTNLNDEKVKNIFNTDYEDPTINAFLKEAKKDDFEAILNGSKYKINNGILEGTVNKIKNIKRVMYGRCSIELLSNKILYQSINVNGKP